MLVPGRKCKIGPAQLRQEPSTSSDTWPPKIWIHLLFQSNPNTAFDVSNNHMHYIGLFLVLINIFFTEILQTTKLKLQIFAIDNVIELFKQLSIYIGKGEFKKNLESSKEISRRNLWLGVTVNGISLMTKCRRQVPPHSVQIFCHLRLQTTTPHSPRLRDLIEPSSQP